MNKILLINFLTISRIAIGVLIFLLLAINNLSIWIVFLFIFGSLTDYFDGYFARKYNLVSEIGEILDPIADKIMVLFCLFGISVYLSSFFIGLMSSVIITREIWISALRDYNSRIGNTLATKVLFISKVKTSIQMITILIYLVAISLGINLLILIADILLFTTTLITVYTGFIYSKNSFGEMHR